MAAVDLADEFAPPDSAAPAAASPDLASEFSPPDAKAEAAPAKEDPMKKFRLNEDEFMKADTIGRLKMMISHPWDKYVASVDSGFKGVEIPRVEADEGTGAAHRTKQLGAAGANTVTGAAGGVLSAGGVSTLNPVTGPAAIVYSAPRFLAGGVENIIDAYKGWKSGKMGLQEGTEKTLGGVLMVAGGAHGMKAKVLPGRGLDTEVAPKTPEEAIAVLHEEAAKVDDPNAKAALEGAAMKVSESAKKGAVDLTDEFQTPEDPVADYNRNQEIEKQFRTLKAAGQVNSPEWDALHREQIEIKNRNSSDPGMPPEEPKLAESFEIPKESEMIPASEIPFNLASEEQVEPEAPAARTEETPDMFGGTTRSMKPTELDEANAIAQGLQGIEPAPTFTHEFESEQPFKPEPMTAEDRARMNEETKSNLERENPPQPEILDWIKGKLPRPEDVKANNDVMHGEIKDLYDSLVEQQKITPKKTSDKRLAARAYTRVSATKADAFFAKAGEGPPLDHLRESANGDGFNFETPAQLIEAVQNSMKGIKTFANPIEPDQTESGIPKFGLGAASHEEFQPVRPSVSATKNAAIDLQRAERGMPPAIEVARKATGVAWDRAMKIIDDNQNAPDELISRLKTSVTPITDVENALILHRQIELQNDFDRLKQKITQRIGSPVTLEADQLHFKQVDNALLDIYNLNKRVGYEASLGFAARKMFANENFSLAEMVTTARAKLGGRELTPEEMAQTERWHEAIAKTQKAFDDYKKVTDERLKKLETWSSIKDAPTRSRVTKYINDRANEARERVKARMAEGRASAGIDPADLRDYSIIGADILARGIEDSAHWGIEMVKELGDAVKPHLEEILANARAAREGLAREALSKATPEETRLKSFKTRTAKSTAAYEAKLAAENFEPKPKPAPLTLDPEAIRLKAENDRAKEAYYKGMEKYEEKNSSPFLKISNTLVNLRRLFLISGFKTAAKVGLAGQGRIGMTMLDSATGSILTKLPGIREVAEGAPREGGMTGGTLEHMVKGYVEGWQYALNQAGKVLKYGRTDAEIAAGYTGYDPAFVNYLYNTHALLKLPAFAQEYKIALRERTAFEMQRGTDMTNPVNQIRVNDLAVADGMRAKFGQSNFLTKRFQTLLESLRNSKEHPTTGAVLDAVLRYTFPIVSIPSNYFAESATYSNLGLGLPRAAYKTFSRSMFDATKSMLPKAVRDAIEPAISKQVAELTDLQKDSIMRHWKKGAFGAGLMLLGYYWRDNIGGYYQPGGTQDPKKPQFGGIRIGGVNLPRWVLHLPVMEPLHFGATVGHVMDHITKKTGEHGSIFEAMMAGIAGLLDEVPYVSNARNTLDALKPGPQGAYARGEMGKGAVVPRGLIDIAEFTDRDANGNTIKRRPKTLLQHIESGIPVLRQNVPKKTPPSLHRHN